MILTLAISAVLVVIALFVLDLNRDQVITSNVSTYLQPFAAETIVTHEFSARPELVWNTITRLSDYNFWFPGILRLLPVVKTDRFVHRYSFDKFDFSPGAFIRIRPFSLAPTFKGKIMKVEENKQLALEMRFNPVHKEIVVFDLNPTTSGTSVTCRRTSRGLFSWLTIWGFSGRKSKILDNLGYFIPKEVIEEKNDSTAEQSSGPQYSRETIIARAVQAGLEGNMDLVNAIPDKPTRGMAKAMLVQSKRKGNLMPDRLVKALSEEPIENGNATTPPPSQNTEREGTLSFSNPDDLVAFVVNRALDGDNDPINAIPHKPTRGKAKALVVKIKRGSAERPVMPKISSSSAGSTTPESVPASPASEPEESLIARMVTEGVNGNMDEINALDNRVLRGKIKAAIVKAKRAKT